MIQLVGAALLFLLSVLTLVMEFYVRNQQDAQNLKTAFQILASVHMLLMTVFCYKLGGEMKAKAMKAQQQFEMMQRSHMAQSYPAFNQNMHHANHVPYEPYRQEAADPLPSYEPSAPK